jgi:hypothetical protein
MLKSDCVLSSLVAMNAALHDNRFEVGPMPAILPLSTSSVLFSFVAMNAALHNNCFEDGPEPAISSLLFVFIFIPCSPCASRRGQSSQKGHLSMTLSNACFHR